MIPASRILAPFAEAALALIYPDACQICGVARATAPEGYVCAGCWSRRGAIKFIVPPFCDRCGLPFEGDILQAFECGNCREMELHFESARAAVAAQGLILEVIHRYKYQRALWFEPFLADLLIRRATESLAPGEWDMIVPVPLHPLKEREREFNQSARLARRVGAALGIPVRTELLRRIEPTRTQTQLSRPERNANVRGAFQARKGGGLKNAHVILIDDVLTTGSTTSACARALRREGASRVCVWTVARSL
jgi:ComF family protein